MKIALAAFLAMAATQAVAAPAATAADRAFVAKVSQGGMYEVAAGKLAQSKGSTQDVRDFATAEVHDHTLVGDRLKAVSASEGVTFPATLNAEFSGKLARLSRLSGTAFDAGYLSDMAAIHDADGAAFAQESTGGGSPAYRAFGQETHRIVLRHIGAIRGAPLPR